MSEWRPKSPRNLTEKQRGDKLVKDSEYEIAVQNLSAEFYLKKHAGEANEADISEYEQTKKTLWEDYIEWSKTDGLYEEVTDEQLLVEMNEGLDVNLAAVNEKRAELGQQLLEIKAAKIAEPIGS